MNNRNENESEKNADPLDQWKSGGPLGSANGSCDIKNGGGNFGPNAYTFNMPKSRLARIFRILIAGLAAIIAGAVLTLSSKTMQ